MLRLMDPSVGYLLSRLVGCVIESVTVVCIVNPTENIDHALCAIG